MPVFNKRDRDDKGSGKIDLDGNTSESDNANAGSSSISGKTIALGAAGVVLAGAAFYFVAGNDDTPEVSTEPETVEIVMPPATEPDPVQDRVVVAPQTPPDSIVVTPPAQSLEQRVSQKLSAIFNRGDCMFGSDLFIGASGREVREGADFSAFSCLYDEGGVSVLLTQGDWAGTRVGFFPRQDLVIVEQVAEVSEGSQGTEFHVLPSNQRVSARVSMSAPEYSSEGVSIGDNEPAVVKTICEAGDCINGLIIRGDLEAGRFDVEIPNGDFYQIDLNTGNFGADSRFLNCPTYVYGDEDVCSQDSYQPVNGFVAYSPG